MDNKWKMMEQYSVAGEELFRVSDYNGANEEFKKALEIASELSNPEMDDALFVKLYLKLAHFNEMIADCRLKTGLPVERTEIKYFSAMIVYGWLYKYRNQNCENDYLRVEQKLYDLKKGDD